MFAIIIICELIHSRFNYLQIQYAYLQDINRNQHKLQNQGKSQVPQTKKTSTANIQTQSQTSQVEETEQRYAVAVEQPIPLHPRAQFYRPQNPYQLAVQQQQQAEQQNSGQQQQQQYQIIPEEQFLKILEEELQARAYHEDQVRRQQAAQQQSQHRQQQQQQHQHQQKQSAAAAAAASQKVALQAQGLGSYRQKVEADEEAQREYIQYVQRARGGPKYLPLPQRAVQEEQVEQDIVPSPQPIPQLPPQLAYYQPQISYKTLPNHPLAKSSLEKEIEMLLASNKPNVAPVQIIDNSNEPSAVINHHHRAPSPPPSTQPSVRSPKAYIPSTAAPPGLVDANNQAFVPSLFRFSNYPQPTQNYPVPVTQQIIDAKKLGPVVYPPQSQAVPSPSAQPPVQASQFYYQEAVSPSPAPRPKAYRSKYGTKFATTPTPLRAHQNEINYPLNSKFTQPLYDIERPAPTSSAAPGGPANFYPSPPDPHRNINPTVQPTPAATAKFTPIPTNFRQFALPGPSPSQSSIYVSQGTGIATPSRPISTVKPKTVEDLKQLHLPPPNGKPLTQAEFQALVDAGYPVTAVPVPVPVPYEQYVKDHPEYRNQPPPQPPALPVNYEQLMRFAQLQQHTQQVPQFGPHRSSHPRALIGRPSEPSVKIISSASEPQQTATAVGGGSVTYLRAIPENQKRRPRDESETKVLGAKEDEKEIDKVKQLDENKEK